MSKREARSFAVAGVDIDAPRAKRRKEVPATSNPNSDGKQDETTNADAEAQDGSDKVTAVEDEEIVKEKGLQLWKTLKDAVNKEGQIASFQFMRLPSKRQYPDYYNLIKRPIALDDIKAKLDAKSYSSLEDVKQDFVTCFRNAKRYNMKESQIFKDAKFLHKLTTKEYRRVTGIREEGHEDGDGSEDEEKKKKKAPTAYRVLKTRLQKLVDKTDSDGRVLSAEFMELPNRKQWPMYYTTIKTPQCLENIFKRLKRKEYPKPQDFANDVELVFSNALEFNLEHTQIWEDAVTLREYFRKLMADLPEPFSIPAYTNAGAHPTKIKLKVPHVPVQPVPAPAPSLPSTNSIAISYPHAASSSHPVSTTTKQDDVTTAAAGPSPRLSNAVKSPKSSTVTPTVPSASVPVSVTLASSNVTRTPAHLPTPSLPATVPQAQKQAQITTLQANTFSHAAPNGSVFQSATVYQPPALVPAPPKTTSTSTTAASAAVTPASAPVLTDQRPSPPSHAYPLKHVVITTMPHWRRLILDHVDGVKTWAVRLDGNEATVVVSDVALLNNDEEADDSTGDEETNKQEEEEEEEEVEAPPPKRRGPGRPPRKRGNTAKVAKKSKGKASEARSGVLEVKLNDTAVKGNDGGTWEVQIFPGMSVLEVGAKGGMVWKIYLDRVVY